MIFAERLGKSYPSGTVAIENVSLRVREHEIIALVGPSGCGKSTLLRLFAGLVPVTSGRVAIDGRPVDGPRSDTGFVFQAPTLLPWQSVLDNVLFGVRAGGRVGAAAVERAQGLIRLVGLDGFADRFPHELSGGMQQRANICRALMLDPSVLLMDEPFGALDALTREELILEVLRIWREAPKTIVFVTHSIAEAIILSDRVVVLSPRPARVVDIIDIALPRPRSFDMEGYGEFQESVRRIRELVFRRAADRVPA